MKRLWRRWRFSKLGKFARWRRAAVKPPAKKDRPLDFWAKALQFVAELPAALKKAALRLIRRRRRAENRALKAGRPAAEHCSVVADLNALVRRFWAGLYNSTRHTLQSAKSVGNAACSTIVAGVNNVLFTLRRDGNTFTVRKA